MRNLNIFMQFLIKTNFSYNQEFFLVRLITHLIREKVYFIKISFINFLKSPISAIFKEREGGGGFHNNMFP